MAAGGQIAEFFGTLGFKIEAKDIKRFDRTLTLLEKRARKFTEGSLSNVQVRITGVRFSPNFNTELYRKMKKKMTLLNNKKGLSPEIKVGKFDVDKEALLRETREAVRYVENNIRMRIRPDMQRPLGASQRVSGVAGGGGNRFAQGLGVGAAGGALGRGFIPGLGVAFGVSQLNKINQEMMGIDFASTAIFGGQEQGVEGMDWLKRFSQEAGLHYRAQAPAYQRMIASATAVGMSQEETQGIFAGVSRYGRTMGLDSESMKGSMRAIEQMLNKSQVYAEELKMQLAEKMPGVISAMAEAATGAGDEEGIQKLFKMMEEGQVSSAEVLGKFAAILDERARQGGAYQRAIKSSAAEQARFNSTFDQMVELLGESGFEEGQAKIFRTLITFLREMNPLVEGLGEAWKYVDAVIRVPLGLIRDFSVGLENFSEYTGIAKGELLAFGTVVAGLLFPLTRIFTLISLGLAIFEDFTAFLTGRNSVIGMLLGDDADSVRQNFIEVFKELGETLKGVIEQFLKLSELLFGDYEVDWVNSLNETLKATKRLLQDIQTLIGVKDEGDDRNWGERVFEDLGFKNSLNSISKEDVENAVFPQGSLQRGAVEDINAGLRWATEALGLGGNGEEGSGLDMNYWFGGDSQKAAPDQGSITISPHIEINGVTDPELVAEAVNRRITEEYTEANMRYSNGVS